MNAFIWSNIKMMRKFGIHIDEALSAGRVAFYEAIEAGHVDKEHLIISVAGKRYIRREMMRAACYHPKQQNMPDYGFENGTVLQRGIRKPATDKCGRWRQKNITLGRCRRCGKELDNETALCTVCRKKVRAYRRKAEERNSQRKAGAKRRTVSEIKLLVGLE